MSYHKFWQTINKSFIGRLVDRKTEAFKELDPQHIYVENIRRFFSIPYKLAKFICDMAVKQHLFNKKIGVYCPDCGRMIESVNNKSEVPDTIKCEVCEQLEHAKYLFKKSECQTLEFYQLNKAVTIE